MSNQGTFRSSIVGTWKLISYRAYTANNPEEFIYPLGEDVQGLLVYSNDGYMSSHIQQPGQKNFESKDLNGGTETELADAARRHFGYTGEFYVDESGAEPILKHHMSISTFPNWTGQTQRRVAKLKGDELILSPERPIEIFGEMRHSLLIWRRMPDNSNAKDE